MPAASTARPAQPRPLAFAALALAAVAALAYGQGGSRLALAALIGGGAGIGLYHASFGFTAAWRRIVRERRGWNRVLPILNVGR